MISRPGAPQVYLAGPFEDGDTWRDTAAWDLESFGCRVVRPELLQEYCDRFGVTRDQAAEILTERDRKFATTSDFVLANFTHATKRSMGTCIELGWADRPGVTTVTVLPADNIHVHPIVIAVSDYVVRTLDEAIAVIESLTWRNS